MKKLFTYIAAILFFPIFLVLLVFYFLVCWITGTTLEFVNPKKEDWTGDFN